jgi:hypothetical protein
VATKPAAIPVPIIPGFIVPPVVQIASVHAMAFRAMSAAAPAVP